MSKKSSKGKQKKELRKNERVKAERTVFARMYDAMFPPKDGKYTEESSRKHHSIMLGIVASLAVVVGLCIVLLSGNANDFHENVLIIPDAYFTSDQKDTVIASLEEQGFKDVEYNPETETVTAHGTQQMVQAYKDSYREKFVDEALEVIARDWSETELGIYRIEINDTLDEVTIYTFTNEVNSSLFSTFLDDDDLYDAFRSIAIWNGMNNSDGTTHFAFKYIVDDTEYYEADASTLDEVVAKIEAEELAKEKEAAGQSTEEIDSNKSAGEEAIQDTSDDVGGGE